MGALDRDHVGRLLDHADRRLLAVGVRADPTERTLGEVEAASAEADLLLDLTDRVRQGLRLFVGRAQDVKGKPLCGALADPRQPAELGDEAGERRRSLAAHIPGRPPMPPMPPVMPPIFEPASSCAARRPSLTAA